MAILLVGNPDQGRRQSRATGLNATSLWTQNISKNVNVRGTYVLFSSENLCFLQDTVLFFMGFYAFQYTISLKLGLWRLGKGGGNVKTLWNSKFHDDVTYSNEF